MIKQMIFKISGMHCVSCALNIDMDLEELTGVKESNTSYAKGESSVTFDSDIVKQEKIIEVIKKNGYEVLEV